MSAPASSERSPESATPRGLLLQLLWLQVGLGVVFGVISLARQSRQALRVETAICYSPDSRMLALTARTFGADWLVLWDTVAEVPRHAVPMSTVVDADFSPSGETLAVLAGDPREVLIIGVADGEVRHRRRLSKYPISIAFSPDGAQLLVTGANGFHGELLDGNTGARVRDLERGSQLGCWTRDGKVLLEWWDRSLWLWDPATPVNAARPLVAADPEQRWPRSFEPVPGAGDRVASAYGTTVVLVDARTASLVWQRTMNQDVDWLALHPTRDALIVGTAWGCVALELESGNPIDDRALTLTWVDDLLVAPDRRHVTVSRHRGAQRIDRALLTTSEYDLGEFGAARLVGTAASASALAAWFLIWLFLLKSQRWLSQPGLLGLIAPILVTAVVGVFLTLLMTLPLYAVPRGGTILALEYVAWLTLILMGTAAVMIVITVRAWDGAKRGLLGCLASTVIYIGCVSLCVFLLHLPPRLQGFRYLY